MTDLAAASPDLARAESLAALPQRAGVVACAVYEQGCRVRDIAVEECGAFIGHEGAVVWLGLHEPDAELQRCNGNSICTN